MIVAFKLDVILERYLRLLPQDLHQVLIGLVQRVELFPPRFNLVAVLLQQGQLVARHSLLLQLLLALLHIRQVGQFVLLVFFERVFLVRQRVLESLVKVQVLLEELLECFHREQQVCVRHRLRECQSIC